MKHQAKTKKKMYKLISFLVAIIVVLLFVFNNDNVKESDQVSYSDEDSFSNASEIHFTHMPITYSLNISTKYGLSEKSNTDNYKIERIKWALEIIENATDNLIEFKEVGESENADIMIYGVPENFCYEEDEEYSGKEGFAGPNVTGNKILDSQVVFCADTYILGYANVAGEIEGIGEDNIGFSWYDGACEDFPLTEIHELLHVFGFDHVYNSNKEIMYPLKFRIKSCEINSINEEVISCLKHIYSNGEIKGDCSKINMYPWGEDPSKNFSDFKWDTLPVTYSVFNCIDRQKWNINFAERIMEKYVGHDLLEFKDNEKVQINFYCQNSSEDVLLNWETDRWSTTSYFPAAQPEYIFEGDEIKEVKITLFGQDRKCGGIELHELLHGLGLRYHYGSWMLQERPVCSEEGIIDKESIEKIKEIYNLE